MSTVLKGITWEHARGYDSVAATAEAYRAVVPGVEVRWEQRSLQAFADQPLESLVEQYDLLVIDHPHIPLASEHGLFARLDGAGHDEQLAILAAQSVGRSHETYAHAGAQWGLATDAAAQVAAYRPDLIPEPPRDWPGVLALAEQGRVLWPYKPVDAFSSLVTVASGNGEEPMRTPGVFLSADALAGAMDTLRRLAALVPPENSTWNPIQAADALSSSDRFAYVPLMFGYTNYSRQGFRANRVKYIDIPSSARGCCRVASRGAGIAVSAASRHPEQAIDLRLLAGFRRGAGRRLFDAGGQPGNSFAWESDRTNAHSLDFFRGTRATLEGAYVRPRFVHYIELQNTLSELVNEALVGRLTDDRLRERLDEGVEEWLVPA